MSEKTKQIQLNRAMTWRGATFAPGLNEMPESAADYAVRRNFGKSVGGEKLKSRKGDESGDETETKTKILTEPEKISGLPEDFPMRHVFEKLGFKSVEEVLSKNREELIALNGIAEATADKALAYGK